MTYDYEKLVLIIEDEPDLSELKEFYLQRHGYDTLAVRDGEAGFDAAFRRWPDLIILNLTLTRMQGLEVCQMLKSNPHTAHIPVLALTAFDGELCGEDFLAAGADDVLFEPFVARQLLARVGTLLEEREAFYRGDDEVVERAPRDERRERLNNPAGDAKRAAHG